MVAPDEPRSRIVRRASPESSETPLDALDGVATPNHLFYVRSHFPSVPDFDPRTWRLTLDDLADRPLSLSLDELRAMPRRELTCTLECAGNGGQGNRLRRGGVSTARWGGVSLAVVLRLAGPGPRAAHVVVRGFDGGVDPEVPEVSEYERSIPLEKALHPDTLLALDMNGVPLPPEHGAPLRLVVPGWYGMDAIKWLARIRLADEPSRHFYMARRYRADYTRGPEVRGMAVKSLIARPVAGARLPLGPCMIEGVAWAGEVTVARVEVSPDGGASWQAAELLGEPEPWTWRLWRLAWHPSRSGEHILMPRARDSLGRSQPLKPLPGDAGHYQANWVERVPVVVAE